MNKKQTTVFAMLALVFGAAISPILSANHVEARPDDNRYVLYGDLTSPDGKTLFGGDKVGFYSIGVKDEFTSIYAKLDHRPSSGMVFEGWLVDVQTGEKHSIGTFKEDHKRGESFTVDSEFHYDVFVVTEEPKIDSDPAPNKPVAGVPLGKPFGQ